MEQAQVNTFLKEDKNLLKEENNRLKEPQNLLPPSFCVNNKNETFWRNFIQH